MQLAFYIFSAFVLVFGFVVFFGAPYLPTHKKQIESGLDLLNLKKGQRLLELGAGDGKVVLAAARRGLLVTAVELNPLLCVVIYARTWRYRRQVKVVCSNFWYVSWADADGVFVFLLDKYMERLDKKIIQLGKNVSLASFAFQIPGKEADRQKDGVFLYLYHKTIGEKA